MLSGGIVAATAANLNWLASAFNLENRLTFLPINLSLLQLRRTMPTPIAGSAFCSTLSRPTPPPCCCAREGHR